VLEFRGKIGEGRVFQARSPASGFVESRGGKLCAKCIRILNIGKYTRTGSFNFAGPTRSDVLELLRFA